MTSPRILLFDLETSPNLAYVWGKWQQDVVAFEEEWFVLSIAWKWLGQKTVHVKALPDFELYEADPHDDRSLIAFIHTLFAQADIAVAHNCDRFDQPKAQTRMFIHSMEPPAPFRSVDTLKVARKHFAFTSNRLDDLCQVLGIGKKRETGGFATWLGCLNGDEAAWRKMCRYNRHDVVLLEQLYLRLLPWMTTHPNRATIEDRPHACPRCGVEARMEARGWRSTQVSKRRQYQCGACKGWSAGRVITKTDTAYVS